MIEFFPPILEHFCPLLLQIAQMGLSLPRWGLILPRNHPQPLFFNQRSHNFIGWYVRTQNTPNPHSKTPLFLVWTWKWANWATICANWTPTGQYVLKVEKTFLEVGQKILHLQNLLTSQHGKDLGEIIRGPVIVWLEMWFNNILYRIINFQTT